MSFKMVCIIIKTCVCKVCSLSNLAFKTQRSEVSRPVAESLTLVCGNATDIWVQGHTKISTVNNAFSPSSVVEIQPYQ